MGKFLSCVSQAALLTWKRAEKLSQLTLTKRTPRSTRRRARSALAPNSVRPYRWRTRFDSRPRSNADRTAVEVSRSKACRWWRANWAVWRRGFEDAGGGFELVQEPAAVAEAVEGDVRRWLGGRQAGLAAEDLGPPDVVRRVVHV